MTDSSTPLFEFSGKAASLGAARNVVRGFLAANGWANRELDVNIAVGEVLQNIVRYGFDANDIAGSFWIGMSFDDDVLVIKIEDNAPPSDPQSWSAAHREAHEGGHGLNLVRNVASNVEFTPLEAGNRAVLRFQR